ncbi:MAG: type II toxin-antitoxin system YafQ family toxin [Pseudomonadota bacterium]|nr:type II toxin-antitoxin system YafQ family toxin [Pseudomonadota bacterium]
MTLSLIHPTRAWDLMYIPVYTKQFEKDLKRCQQRGNNIKKFKILARTLIADQPIDAIYQNHKLIGNYVGRWECHLESDWILIYKINENQIIFERMGTHADLFK